MTALHPCEATLNCPINVGGQISVGHTNFIPKVELMWLQDPKYALNFHEDCPPTLDEECCHAQAANQPHSGGLLECGGSWTWANRLSYIH